MPERAREIMELVGAGVIGGGGVGGFWAWLSSRKPSEAAMVTATAALQTALNDAVKSATESLRAELERVTTECQHLRAHVERLEADRRSLIAALDRAGISWEQATEPGALLTVIDGEAAVMPPRRRRRRSRSTDQG